jgi:hypothetical protein
VNLRPFQLKSPENLWWTSCRLWVNKSLCVTFNSIARQFRFGVTVPVLVT